MPIFSNRETTLTLLRSLGVFVLIYSLSFLPLPGISAGYCTLFRHVAEVIFGGDRGPRNLAYSSTPDSPYDTRIVIANRASMDAWGGGPVWNVDLDTMAMGWNPTAFLLALTIATPIAFLRRLQSLALGLAIMQALILGALGYFIWIESAGVGLVSLTPFWNHLTQGFATAPKEQIGFAIPIFVWILTTFTRSDFALLSASLPAKTSGRDKFRRKDSSTAR
jgi:hypothetical protein